MSKKTVLLHEKVLQRVQKIFEATFKRAYVYSRKKYEFHGLSFSQEGEDLVLERVFDDQKMGFYIDIGAHHPQRFSNTYLFYLKGWQGINIDAMPGSMKAFNAKRPRDINIETAISNSGQDLKYYIFDEPALNGFSESLSLDRDQNSHFNILETKIIKTKKLSEILNEYLPKNQVIDFLSIDVEGLDYEALISNDWLRYKPRVILVEELAQCLDEVLKSSQIREFLKSNGYDLFARTFNTSFYRLESFS
jgi:FkbM family methyltransferase